MTLNTGGSFVKYDFESGIRTVIRMDILGTADNMSSAYDRDNHRLFCYGNEQLTILNTISGGKQVITGAFHEQGTTIEYDSLSNSLFAVENNGIFAKYDLTQGARSVLRMDILGTAYNMSSAYDKLNRRFFCYGNEQLTVLDIATGNKTIYTGAIHESGTVIEYVPEPATLLLLGIGLIGLRTRKA